MFRRIICVALLLTFSWLLPAAADTWKLDGTLVTPEAIVAGGTVVITDQLISDVGVNLPIPPNARPIPVTGIVLPGLIDLHNHITWNALPRWHPPQKYLDRYEWQELPEYDRVLRSPWYNLMTGGLACELDLFAEVKALIGGATSIVGSDGRSAPCANGLVRNLDLRPDFPPYPSGSKNCPGDSTAFPPGAPNVVISEVFPLQTPDERIAYYKCELENGRLRSFIVHLGEGTDASARREFLMLKGRNLLLPHMAIVHGTALGATEFADMAANHMGLVWSPRSNLELYGVTTNIPAALQARVSIALAPDWSPTGSAGMLQELNFAAGTFRYLSPQQLVSMVTSAPAQIARLDDRIGKLVKDQYADILVIRDRPGAHTAYETVTTATPADIQLILVGGRPVYGDYDLMQKIVSSHAALVEISVCGTRKVVDFEKIGYKWDDILKKLSSALSRYGTSISTFECG